MAAAVGNAARRVALASTTPDAEAAALIALGLATSGFTVVATREPHEVVVVLLSRSSAAEPGFLEAHVTRATARPVPVALEDVGGTAHLPPGVVGLNWIWWDAERPEAANRTLAAALVTDQQTYADSRTLETKAWAWVNAGRGKDELLTSTRQVAQAVAVDATEVGRRGQDATVSAFLEASLAHARRLRWRRLTNAALTSIAAVVALVAAAGLLGEVRTVTTRSRLAVVANDETPVSAADLSAVKVAAFILLSTRQGDDLVGTPVTAHLATLLSQPWPQAQILSVDSAAVNGFAAYDQGSKAWLARGDGTVHNITLGGRPLGTEVRIGGPVYDLATNTDGTVVLAANAVSAWLVKDGRVVGTYPLTGAPRSLAVSADGTGAALEYSDRVEVLDVSAGGLRASRKVAAGDVLGLAAADDGSLLALVRSGGSVAVVDVTTGSRRWHSGAPQAELLTGAVGPDGSVALNAQRGLWWSDGEAPLRPAGIPTADLATALAVNDGIVAVSSDAGGTQVYDMRLEVPLPDTCRSVGSVRRVFILRDSRTVVCDGHGIFEVWSLERPSAPQVVDIRAGDEIDAGAARLPEDVVLFGDVTASATLGSTVVLGTRMGEVVEFDLPDQGPGRLTGRWQMSDGTPVSSLAYSGSTSLTVNTEAARWSLRPCPGCGLDVTRQLDAVVERHKRCFAPDLTTLVPEDLIDTLAVRLCRDTV